MINDKIVMMTKILYNTGKSIQEISDFLDISIDGVRENLNK